MTAEEALERHHYHEARARQQAASMLTGFSFVTAGMVIMDAIYDPEPYRGIVRAISAIPETIARLVADPSMSETVKSIFMQATRVGQHAAATADPRSTWWQRGEPAYWYRSAPPNAATHAFHADVSKQNVAACGGVLAAGEILTTPGPVGDRCQLCVQHLTLAGYDLSGDIPRGPGYEKPNGAAKKRSRKPATTPASS